MDVVGSNLKMVKFFMQHFVDDFVVVDQVLATMSRPGMRTSSIFNTQRVATRRSRVAKRAQHARNNVAIFCDRLAGACKCWVNNVGIYCVEMLRSFGRDFRDTDRPLGPGSVHGWEAIQEFALHVLSSF